MTCNPLDRLDPIELEIHQDTLAWLGATQATHHSQCNCERSAPLQPRTASRLTEKKIALSVLSAVRTIRAWRSGYHANYWRYPRAEGIGSNCCAYAAHGRVATSPMRRSRKAIGSTLATSASTSFPTRMGGIRSYDLGRFNRQWRGAFPFWTSSPAFRQPVAYSMAASCGEGRAVLSR
jgi:hypothetical protein